MGKTRKVIDGVPVRLHGIRRGVVSIVTFIHKCCGCGLQHDVTIKHNGKDPDVDIKFTRKY